ncbi:polycystin-1 isoform X3 [Electrophorus electricus]|uniref:polycystin-1 isoform X3 n=1 Tax=Electrophorus electricus TaxID=8005 RepID=UPI0015D06953|nr:polycystin-1 isoform X3 [Electrophorus electricus]
MAAIVPLLSVWILGAVTSCSCDEDFCAKGAQIDRDSLHCYWMPTSASTWLHGRNICQRVKGGDLALVDKANIQNFIKNTFQLEVPALVWLRNGVTTNPHQHSGPGAESSPDGDEEQEICPQMALALGQWMSGPCNQEHRFICGKEMSVPLPTLDSSVAGVPLMSSTYTQALLLPLPSAPDLEQRRVEMMLFPGLWFSHGGQVLSVDLVSQPSQQITMVKVQILRPYCSLSHHLVPPGCSSLSNPFSCCHPVPLCNTTGGCTSGQYWCPLLESCLPVTRPCSTYHSSTGGRVFPLPPRYSAVAPFYHIVADVSLKIPPASERVHFKVTFQEKQILVYPDDILAVQHSRQAGAFLHCVSGSDSGWRQSYLSLPGPEWGGWLEAGLTGAMDRGRWVDGVVCDLRLIYQDTMHLYGVSLVLNSTKSEFGMVTTTPATSLVNAQTPVSGMSVLHPKPGEDNLIHLPVNVPTLIIIKILSGYNATSAWSAPVSKTRIPFLLSCPPEMLKLQGACERDTPDTRFSYAYVTLYSQGEQTLNITASNKLNSQTLSVKLQAHILLTGLHIEPQGFHRVLVDIPQLFTAAVATGSSMKYTWVIDNLVQLAHTGEVYTVVFKKPGGHILKVTAENPVSSQFIEVKISADAMAPLSNLDLLFKEDAIAVNTSNIYILRLQMDISIGVTIRWDFGDSSPCVNHTVSAPLERSNNLLDLTTTQMHLEDSAQHTYTNPGEYTLRIQAQNKYDHIEKAAQITVRSPLTRLLVSSLPTIPKVNQTVLFEASSLSSSYGILYTWNFGSGPLEITGAHNTIKHSFKAAGVYNVSVCANNGLSRLVAWMTIEVAETISGLFLSYNGPNELNSVTEISGTVSTGTGLRWTFELGDGSVFNDLPKSLISHIYRSEGNYTVCVTVTNAVSTATQSINVEIYKLSIQAILPFDCIASGKEITLQTLVTGNVSLLTFHWSFGDGTPLSVRRGTSKVAHTFSGSGNYLTNVVVYSQAGFTHYQSNVCVEALITDLSLHLAQNTVAVGEEICLNVSVLPTGGNGYQFLWYNSSSSDSPVHGKSHHCFVFSKEGMHEIMVLTHNQVSHKIANATIFVQQPVLKLSIQRQGTTDAFKVNESYYFWTEPSQNNGIIEWDFGDGTLRKEGQNQTHAFTSSGSFRVTASVSNAVSQESVYAYMEVQIPISSLVIHTNLHLVEAGQETVFTVVSNVMDNVHFYWTVDPLFPTRLGMSENRYVFPKAGVFEVKVTVENLVSKMENSTSIVVVERIRGVKITSQMLISMRYFPTKQTITFTAFVKYGSSLTFQWLAYQDGLNGTVGEGEHFKFLANNSGDVSVKLTVSNALGKVHSNISLRAVERISGVNISTPEYVVASGKPVKISVSAKTGTDLQYIWFLDSDRSPVTSDVPFVFHIFKATGIFNVKVSVANTLGSADATKQFRVLEDVSGTDFEVDGKTHPFFFTSNSFLQFHGFIKKGNVLYWEWTVAFPGRNVIILGNNQTVSYSFRDVGENCVTLNASNDISWQTVSHIITVQDAIQGLNLRVSEPIICENEPVTFTPSVSQGSGVLFILIFSSWNSSLSIQEVFTTASLPVGNHIVKAIAKNHVSFSFTSVTVQVMEKIKGLHLINCCSAALEASKSFIFKASVSTKSEVTYQWTFSLDGFNTSQKIGQNVLFSPSSNGSLSVTVEASTNFCSQSITKTATVQWPVKGVRLAGYPEGPFIDQLVTFLALTDSGSDLEFRWDFGDSDDAIKVAKSNRAIHRYIAEGRFVVQVTVFNNVSQISAQMPVVVRTLDCIQPQVTLIQEQSKIFGSRPNYFEAIVDLNGCASYKTTYLWEIFHDSNCIENKVPLDSLMDVTTPLLFLPRHTLVVGDYCVKFTTRFQGTPLRQHKTIKVSVIYSPLVPLIRGGSHRLWSSQNDLVLDGTESYDPDCGVEEDKLLQFQWNVTLQQSTTVSHAPGSFHTDQPIQLNSSTLILPSYVLKLATVYQITLTVQKDGRSPVSTKQSVTVYEADMLPVTVKCVSCSLLFSSYVSLSHPTVLSGHCALCNGTLQYKWTAENTRGEVLHLNEVTTTTGDSNPDLVIRPDVLRIGWEYVFSLNVSQPSTGLWGSAGIAVTPNLPPQRGNCTLSSEDSVQLLQNMVSFNCSGWVNEDSKSAQIIYSLQAAQCEDPGPQCSFITLYRGTQHTFKSMMPLGSARTGDNTSIITVLLQIEDNMGAKVTALRRNLWVVLPVSVPGTTERLKKKSQRDLWALLQQGKPQDVLLYSTALTSHLNQLEVVSVQDAEDRMQIRGSVLRVLASLSVTSLQDAAQISSALAHATVAVPAEYGDSHTNIVEAMRKMIRVIREQTRQGDVTPIDTGRNILKVLSSFMTTVEKQKNTNAATSEMVLSALKQAGELMRSLMWSRMPGEEPVSLRLPQIHAVGFRGDPTSNLLCTAHSRRCQFHVPPALSSQLRKERGEVLQILLVMQPRGNPFISAAEPPISTTLAAVEFATPEGLPIPIANLTSGTAIHVILHNQEAEFSPRVNISLPQKGSVNFTVKAVKTDPHAGLFIAFNFSLMQGTGQKSSGQLSITVADQQSFLLSQQTLIQELTLSLSADVPSMDHTIFLTPLLNGSAKDLYVTLSSSVDGAQVLISTCVFGSLCQFFSMEQRRWSTEGLSVLSSSNPRAAHCLTRHLTLFGASLFVHPDAIVLLPPSDRPARNVVVGIVCGVLLLIHLLVGLIAHKLDHVESVRLSCVPLCGQPGRYRYRVLVKTGWQRGSGTSAHVGISLYGLNKSGSRHLRREGAFQRNGLDDFQVETDANLGEIWKICIWHDNTGLEPSWYLQHVIVWDMQMDNLFFFLVEDWLSVENENNSGMVRKVVLATCPLELQQFGRILRAQLHFGLREHHLWLSLWERPAHSTFSRAQRVTCSALLVHLYLAAGAVWYGSVGSRSSSGPVAEHMLMNLETVLVGMTVAVLMFPLQFILTFLFRMTKSKVVMERSLPPSPVGDTVEMDVNLSHAALSYSSFLSLTQGPGSSTQEGASPFTESLDGLKLECESRKTSNFGRERVDEWASGESICDLPESTGPARLLKRNRALLQLQLTTSTSDLLTFEHSSSPYPKNQPFYDEDPRTTAALPGPTAPDSGRCSPNETFLCDSQESYCSEPSEQSVVEMKHEAGLYGSSSSLSVCSLASTYLPSLPADSLSTTSNTRIGVPRGGSALRLPSWVLVVVYLMVFVVLGTCLAMVGLYGGAFSSSTVLMWLTSLLSAFLTSALLIEPLVICVRAVYLAAVVKPVDPEVEERLAWDALVRSTEEDCRVEVHPPCGYGLLQAKEEARKLRKLHTLMRNCLVYTLFLLLVLMVNYQENIQERNGRMLHSAVKHSIMSGWSGQPTALSGWMEAWQWLDQSLAPHLHHNPSLSLIGLSRLQRVKTKNFCEETTKDSSKHRWPSITLTSPVSQRSNSGPVRGMALPSSSAPRLSWPWTQAQSCVLNEAEVILLRNSSMATSHILSGVQTAHWIPAETRAVVVEFTQYHRQTGLLVPVSILLENSQSGRILSTISIQAFHIPSSSSGLDLSIALTALLLLSALGFLTAELRMMVQERAQYLSQGRRLLQLLLALLALATASLRLGFLCTAMVRLSSQLSQPDTYTSFSGVAGLARSASQLAAVLLNLLALQMVGVLRFVRRWVVLSRMLRQACSEICGVVLGFLLLQLLFIHTGCVLFSASVEGFSTWWRAGQSLLGLLRSGAVLHHLCQQHPALGPLYCLAVFGLAFWALGRLCKMLTYKMLQAEMYRPVMETQGYEMVEFLIKRLKMWMGLSKTKEFRHRVKFEGMEGPPSRSSQYSQLSILSVPSCPAGPRLLSSPSSLASETSILSDSQELQQHLDRLLPSVDSLLAGFSRINQLTNDVLNIELQLQKAQRRKKQKKPQLLTTPEPALTPKLPQPNQPNLRTGLKTLPSSHHDAPGVPCRRRATHSESSILGSPTHPTTHPTATTGSQSQQQPQPMDPERREFLERRGFPRRRAWHSGSCHSANTAQRSSMSQDPGAFPARPRSEEGERGAGSEGMPIKRTAWSPDTSNTEDYTCPLYTTEG